MSLDNIIPNAALERPYYHLLSQAQLEQLDDAEALYECGRRLVAGLGLHVNEDAGWDLVVRAAQQGHPLAQGSCFQYGRACTPQTDRALALYRKSAERGHPCSKLKRSLLVLILICCFCS